MLKQLLGLSVTEHTGFQHLKIKDINSVVRSISLARPKLNNAFNPKVIEELTTAFGDLQSNKELRAVILSGEGKCFSAGADLNWMKDMAKYSEEDNRKDSYKLFDMFSAIRNSKVPVIGRVQGPALGGGSGLVAACDIALASSSAKFGFTEVKLGLLPAVISPFVIEKMGSANCSRYFLTGEIFPASEAVKVGLVQQCYKDEDELDNAITDIVEKLVKNSPQAVCASKNLIKHVNSHSIQDSKEYVCGEIAKIRVSEEGQEGLRAFLDKSSPSFSLSLKPKE